MLIKRIGSGLLHLSVLLLPEPARAEGGYGGEEGTYQIFEYGSSCETLGQLSRVELVGITHKTYNEQFAIFCKPDSVYRCDDYNSVLLGLGHLEDNGRGSCRYLPDSH